MRDARLIRIPTARILAIETLEDAVEVVETELGMIVRAVVGLHEVAMGMEG